MRHLTSPHCNERPDANDISLIVLHAISLPPGEFAMDYVEALFMGCLDCACHPEFVSLAGLEVSAHFVVDRDGGITQFVPCHQRAWHAGVSSWHGREGCNDFAIGIEMIGDQAKPFTDAQYRETARLCRSLMLRYPQISLEDIVGHEDIAPGRKWDPGKQWRWNRFYQELGQCRHAELEVL